MRRKVARWLLIRALKLDPSLDVWLMGVLRQQFLGELAAEQVVQYQAMRAAQAQRQ